MSDDMIARARRIVDDKRNQTHLRPWAEALLAEREAREQAERERDAAARFGESTQDWLRARVATLEAALREMRRYGRYMHPSNATEFDREIDAALGEQNDD